MREGLGVKGVWKVGWEGCLGGLGGARVVKC